MADSLGLPSYFKKAFLKGLDTMGSMLYKRSTLDSYTYLNRSWVNFLESGPAGAIPHADGVVLMDLKGGRLLAALLVAYLGYLNERVDKGKRRYSVTTQRGRVASVIAYHRLAFHEIGKLPLVWSAITKLERLHIPREKCWLNVTQFRILGLAVWSLNHSSPLELVYRMVYTLMTETIYRIGNILPQNPTSKLELCDFQWEDFEFKRDGRRQILEITLDEKRDRRRVKTPKVAGGRIHKRLKSGSVYEATYLAREEVSTLSGYLAVEGVIITQPMFRKWLRELVVEVGIDWRIDGALKNFTPSDLRRSSIQHMYEYVGDDRARYMMGHSSAETARRFYMGMGREESYELLSKIPWGAAALLK